MKTDHARQTKGGGELIIFAGHWPRQLTVDERRTEKELTHGHLSNVRSEEKNRGKKKSGLKVL